MDKDLMLERDDRRISRRELLRTAAALGAGVAASGLLAACGGNPKQSSTNKQKTGAKGSTGSSGNTSQVSATKSSGGSSLKVNAAGQPQHGGVIPTPRNKTVVVDQVSFTVFDSFNPFIANGWQYNAGIQQIYVENLFYDIMTTGEIKPWLGKKYSYNSDFTELTLELNPKAKWSDGKPFTAKDVAYSIKIQSDPQIFGSLQGIKSTSTPDAHTVVIKLTKPNPRFHHTFICGIIGSFIVVPEHIWSKQNPKKFRNNPPVFTGPYMLDKTIQSQLMYIWKKNPNYWNKDAMDPKPEYVVYRTAPVPDSEVNEFKRNTVDVAGFDYTHAQAVQGSGYKDMEIVTGYRDPIPRGIAVNCDPKHSEFLSNPQARWAISYLVDREKIGKTVWQPSTPPAQYPWADYKSNAQWENKDIADKYQLTYDPSKAEQLLDKMGAKKDSNGKRSYKGKALNFTIITPVAVGQPEYIIGQLLAQELQKIGIGATIHSYSGSVFGDKFGKGDWDIASEWFGGVTFDPMDVWSQFAKVNWTPLGKSAGTDQWRLFDKEMNSIVQKLSTLPPDLNNPQSKQLYNQALERYYQTLGFMPVIQTTYANVFNTTYWTGWPSNDNLYTIPADWWGQFMFAIGNLKPTGKS